MCTATFASHKAIYLQGTATQSTLMHYYEKIVDDIIQWSETMEQAFFRICSLLSHCNKNGMVFSPDKFVFAKETVEFAGFIVTKEGIKPTDTYIEAIRNFPTPTNISEVRSWFGLINQVAYSFVNTEHMAPFRHLLSKCVGRDHGDRVQVEQRQDH